MVECQYLQLKTNRITARRWRKCSLRPSDDVPLRWWGRSCVCSDKKPPEWHYGAMAVLMQLTSHPLLWRGWHGRASAQNLVNRYTPHVIPRVTVDQISTWSSVDAVTTDAAAAIVHAFGVELLIFGEVWRWENLASVNRPYLFRVLYCTRKNRFFKTGLIIGLDPLSK